MEEMPRGSYGEGAQSFHALSQHLHLFIFPEAPNYTS